MVRPRLQFDPPIKPSILIVILFLFIGAISFVYADGLNMLYQTWHNLTAPKVTFMVKPEKLYLAADGDSQLYIDIQIKDQDKQLIDGDEIIVSILDGEASITNSDNPPTEMSKRILVRSAEKPQMIVLSVRYKQLIKTVKLEAFDTTPPDMPIITAPIENTVFTTSTPIISGEAPTNTWVDIYIDETANTTIAIKDSHQFSEKIQTAIKKGSHMLSATTVNKYGVRSKVTVGIPIEIRTPDPEIDLLNLRIKPNPIIANESFQFFIPVSSGTKEVILVLDGNNYPLLDTNGSSIFSGNIPAPHTPGLYSISLEITTETDDRVIVEKAASIVVK